MENFCKTTTNAVDLLSKLIALPSLSREEEQTGTLIFSWLEENGHRPQRHLNNVWAWARPHDNSKPTILLNSHHDTVRPGSNWMYDPFTPTFEGDKLVGLGSNDAGASVVSLLGVFHLLAASEQPYNLVVAITAEEEVSGTNGVASILPELGPIDLGIVGEPTQMQMAIAERGLLVLDCYIKGQTGHAARNEGVNAIYKALPAIEWFRNHPFTESRGLLGPVKMSVTQINAGTQHNVVPDLCHLVVDVRVNECYSNQEICEKIEQSVDFEVKPRSFRLNSSYISPDHPVVQRGTSLGLGSYGSPTTSDQALMPFSTIKIGPGDSARSHTPNEYVYIDEIANGIETYWRLLDQLALNPVKNKI
ncbi:MAG: M20 family metallo-hydrolase [Breznakibacter sp.]